MRFYSLMYVKQSGLSGGLILHCERNKHTTKTYRHTTNKLHTDTQHNYTLTHNTTTHNKQHNYTQDGFGEQGVLRGGRGGC